MALIDVTAAINEAHSLLGYGVLVSYDILGMILTDIINQLASSINVLVQSVNQSLSDSFNNQIANIKARLNTLEAQIPSIAGLSQAAVDAEINDALTIYDGIIANQEASIIDYINGIYTKLNNADKTVGGKITEAVDESASMLSEAADTAYNTLENSFSTVGSTIMVAVNGVSDYLSGGIDAVYNGLAELVQDVINIPAKLIDKAIELLVPAEALAWTAKMANFIIGQPMTSLMIIIGNMLNGVFGNVFKFDEEDFKEGIKTAMLFISDQTQKAMYTAPGD